VAGADGEWRDGATMTSEMAAEASTDEEQATELAVGFDDLFVLSTGGVDAFVLNWNESETAPPFYVDVGDRRFAFTSDTYLVTGHGAQLPEFLSAEEAEGRLTLLVEREGRYLVYSHDPNAPEDDEAE
jgi:hypothetical protein